MRQTIGNKATLGNNASGPRSQTLRGPRLSRTMLPVRLLLFLFLVSSIPAWSLLSTSTSASATDANLPDAPEPQAGVQSAALASPLTEASGAEAGSIHGVVADRDGAVYQGVQITLTQAVPGPTPANTTTSDSNGQFQFSNVSPGSFKLTVSSQGFNTQIISGMLHPGESYHAPVIALAFATATSEVQVTASRVEVAQEQLHEEEQQRVFGVIPNFYVVYAPNAQPLNTRQKFHLAWKSSIDPVTFVITGATAGIEQADNGLSGYGQGAQGYAKRFGASYADNFVGTMIGSAILPSILKQDPRYFYKGTGTIRSRIFYAIANSVVCKGDNGQWQTNYSGILGSLAAGGISNLYYPASDRNGVSLTIQETLLGIAQSAAQNVFQEFLVRRFTPKLPNYQLTKP
jgi:hypothetical protein